MVTIEDAARHARAILASAAIVDAPTPVAKIAKYLAITVQNIALDDEMSGMSFIKNDISVIVINAGHHPNRQRFTLAHELGHHVLHKEYLLNNVHIDKTVLHRNNRSAQGIDAREIQANAFAAELLMPASKMRRYKDIDINNEVELIAVAKLFQVSTSAIAFRILNLS